MNRMIAVCLSVVGAAYCGFCADYYVDAVSGNDANDGLAAGEGHAMESFAALFAKYTIKSGDKVHAAAGIYTNGVMKSGSVKYRLVVPAGVEVIGAGTDMTTIEGQAHTNELGEVADLTASPWGCGANALRGVYLGKGAILRKFTITKSYTPNYSDQTGAESALPTRPVTLWGASSRTARPIAVRWRTGRRLDAASRTITAAREPISSLARPSTVSSAIA